MSETHLTVDFKDVALVLTCHKCRAGVVIPPGALKFPGPNCTVCGETKGLYDESDGRKMLNAYGVLAEEAPKNRLRIRVPVPA